MLKSTPKNTAKNTAKNAPKKPASLFKDGDMTRYFISTLPDLMFVLLPFIVILMVQIVKGTVSQILYVTEWAFAAAVLSGQIIVKVTTAVIEAPVSQDRSHKESQEIAVTITAVIVLILVPSLIVLSLMLYLDTPSPLLVAAQILLFAVTIIVYTIFNMASLAVLEKRKSKE